MVASVRALRNEGYDFARVVLYVGAPIAALLLLALVWDMLRRKPGTEKPAEGTAPAGPAAFDPMAGGYPVPPLPGQELPPVPRRRSRAPQLQDALNGADHSEGS
jgi:NADH-quinone oxidoreductase subunit H